MQPVFDLFSDIFAYRDNALTRIDPRVKFALSLLVLFCVIRSSRVMFPLSVFCACFACMFAIRLPARILAFRMLPPLGVVFVLILLQALLTGSTPLFTLALGPWTVAILEEGVSRGGQTGARVLGAVSMLLLLGFTTRAHQIFHSLRWLGMPKGWVEVAILMYRYTFLLVDQATDILDAQRLRLGYSDFRRSLSSVSVLAGTTIIQAMDQGMRTHEAMTLRGYNGYMPFGPQPVMSARDRLLLVLAASEISLAYVLMELVLW